MELCWPSDKYSVLVYTVIIQQMQRLSSGRIQAMCQRRGLELTATALIRGHCFTALHQLANRATEILHIY